MDLPRARARARARLGGFDAAVRPREAGGVPGRDPVRRAGERRCRGPATRSWLHRRPAVACRDLHRAEHRGRRRRAFGTEKARFYRIARRSATECAAVLDVCAQLGLVTPERFGTGRELLLRIVSMLTKLGRSVVSGTGTGTGTDRTDP